MVRYIVTKYGARLDLKLTTHQLRHACATHLVQAGMKLTDVQRLLGHSNLDSTERYTQIPQQEMEREFRYTRQVKAERQSQTCRVQHRD